MRSRTPSMRYFIFNTCELQKVLRDHQASLAIRLTIDGPLKQRSHEEPVLGIGRGEATDGVFDFRPLILRIQEKTLLESACDDERVVRARRHVLADLRRDGDASLIVN